MIAADGVTVRRGGRAIVADVSLHIAPGSFVGLIGGNGAGKSTLIAALVGLLRPDEGQVRYDGQDVAAIDRRTLSRRRAFVPQSPRAEWPISVERVVALGLTPHLPAFGGLPAGWQARIDEALRRFDLLDRRDQPVTTLSGGELARAMLARALVGEPQVLIADEPLAGLDPRHALDGVARLRAEADAGRLVIASLHDLTLAARATTHIAAMREGRLVAFGPTASVMTSRLISDVYDVEACLVGQGATAYVDFVGARSAA